MKALTTEQKLNILQLFVGCDELRPALHTPLKIVDKNGDQFTVATDSNAMAIVRGHIGEWDVQSVEDSERYSRVLFEERNLGLKYMVQDIENAIEKTPFVFAEEGDECKACYGSGYVDYEFVFDRHIYTEEYECPLCKGVGEVNFRKTERKEYDYNFRTQMGNDHFAANQLIRLVSAAKIAETDHIFLTYQLQEASKASMFQIGDIEIMQMPLSKHNNERPNQTILSCPA